MSPHFRIFGRELSIEWTGPGEQRGRRELRCSFCGASQESAAKMIAGQKVFICGECAEAGRELVAGEGSGGARGLARVDPGEGELRCSFCNQSDKPMAAGGESRRICSGCLAICAEILTEDRLIAARRPRS